MDKIQVAVIEDAGNHGLDNMCIRLVYNKKEDEEKLVKLLHDNNLDAEIYGSPIALITSCLADNMAERYKYDEELTQSEVRQCVMDEGPALIKTIRAALITKIEGND